MENNKLFENIETLLFDYDNPNFSTEFINLLENINTNEAFPYIASYILKLLKIEKDIYVIEYEWEQYGKMHINILPQIFESREDANKAARMCRFNLPCYIIEKSIFCMYKIIEL